MPRILNLDPESFSAKARSILKKVGRLEERPLSRSGLLREIGGYDVLFLRFAHRIDRAVLDAADRLKCIATNVTGLDHIDVEEARRRGIEVFSLKGEYEFLRGIWATAEHTWGLLLSLVRHLPAAVDSVKRGRWDREDFLGRELAGKRMGILGLGRIGEKMARYAQAFNMKVHVYTKGPIRRRNGIIFHKQMRDLLSSVDILSIHLPLDQSTRGCIGWNELTQLPRGSYLLNTSRGALIDSLALLKALKTGRLAGAALDVLPEENAGDLLRSPLVAYARKNPGRLMITPHIGGATIESWEKTEVFIAEKVARFFAR